MGDQPQEQSYQEQVGRLVFGTYGVAMSAAQNLELSLAMLAMSVRQPKVGRDPRRALRRHLSDWAHRMERSSASELRNEIRPLVTPETWEELEWAIEERNRLAHRFFRESLARGTLFEVERGLELLEAAGRFQALSQTLSAQANSRYPSLDVAGLRDEGRAHATVVTGLAMRGELGAYLKESASEDPWLQGSSGGATSF